MTHAVRTVLALAGALLLGAAGPAHAQAPLPERFTAFAVNMSGIGNPTPTPLDITITGWTNAADQERYISILRGRGGDAMVEALRRAPSIGSIRTPTSLAYDFRYAIQERTRDHLRRIILLSDRPMEFAELVDRSHSVEYPFLAIELLVDDAGRGKGSLWLAAKLTLLDDLLILDNYADRPVTLNDVKRVTGR